MQDAIDFAANAARIDMDTEARALWIALYPELSAAHAGLFGAATSRAEMHTVRLAVAIAVLCRSHTIGAEHLRAALELWRYSRDSARFIYGRKIGDSVADSILAELQRAAPEGVSRMQIRQLLGHHVTAHEIAEALAGLKQDGVAREERRPSSGGRPQELWFLVEEQPS